MNVITISREYGAGGYELAHRLAETLGWELLDRELLHQAAAVEHLPDAELERLDEKAISLADRFRLNPPHARYIRGLREAAQQAAVRGNVILVGRGTDQLIPDTPSILRLRLVAPREWRDPTHGATGGLDVRAGPGPLHRARSDPQSLHALLLWRGSLPAGQLRPGR